MMDMELENIVANTVYLKAREGIVLSYCVKTKPNINIFFFGYEKNYTYLFMILNLNSIHFKHNSDLSFFF